MNKYIFSAVGCVLLLTGTLWSYPFSGDCQPYGSVNHGDTSLDGYEVVALIGNEKFAQSKVKNGSYSLFIPPDNLQTQDRKEGWAENDTIIIKIDGKIALPSIMAEEGIKEVNLIISSLGTDMTTWGKIKALFR